MSYVIYPLAVLGILVFVHEFGHYAVAKLCGVRVEVFSLGFGKRLIGFRRGDTDYRISLLPIGGYVKKAGGKTHRKPPRDYWGCSPHHPPRSLVAGLARPTDDYI